MNKILKLIAFLATQERTVEEIKAEFNISATTAGRKLVELRENGFAIQEGKRDSSKSIKTTKP